ncbi:hypothetical protein TrCOL_g1799 [Triparma columacea]|uniref:EF-hand domain-containing protein n=1 Tax=Triparma columacea TaxID=722753 RepID=A0A9W7GEC4_9STRA|nr:hypothetical protein TrCOL_g1799 [Triparma columacea]
MGSHLKVKGFLREVGKNQIGRMFRRFSRKGGQSENGGEGGVSVIASSGGDVGLGADMAIMADTPSAGGPGSQAKVPSESVPGSGEAHYARTPKANESVKLIFDYVDSQEKPSGVEERTGGGGDRDDCGDDSGVAAVDEKDPAFKKRRKTKINLLRFGRRNKKALYGKPKSERLMSPATQVDTTPNNATSRRSVYGDGFNKHMPQIGETLLEHQRRTLLPKLRYIADVENSRVADNASTLISDAMHLRNVNSHRWNKVSLRFYKARNSRAYHIFGFMVIMAHTVLSMFESPRDEWEHVTEYLKFADEAVQKNVCSWANFIIVSIYFLDIVVQLCFQRVAWHDVDWASTYVLERGRRDIESTARSFRKHFVSSLRESSFAGGVETESLGTSFLGWMRYKIAQITKLKFNFIFLFNFIVVAFMVFATATKLPSRGAFLRPGMFLFTNYRIQTACSALVKMLPHLTDILLIIFLCIIVFAAITCAVFEEVPSASSSPQEGFSSFWYALLNYYVLLSTENFPSILDRFEENFVAWVFIAFLVLAYFIFFSYMTAIVFDGYYDVKIQISLQEYLTERSALVTAFLCIAYDPLGDVFNEVLTLGDLIEANLTFHGKSAGIEMVTELFLELDADGSKTLDELEFYHFCDGVVSLLERLENQDLETESFDHPSGSGSFDVQGRQSFSSEDGDQRRRSSFNAVHGGWSMVRNWRKYWRRVKLQFWGWFARYVDKLVPEEGTHILFNHIMQIFRSGLMQIFFILALIWTFAFAIIAMNVLGKQECINKAVEALGEDVDDYEIPYYERFDTFPNSMVAMFRLATGSGWNDIMFLYWPCETPWGGTNFSPFFFVAFHFSFCIVFYNVLGGLIFAHYKQLSDSKGSKMSKEARRRKQMKRMNRKRRNTRRSINGTGDKRASILRTRRASQIPEMRQSARFWRQALKKEGGGGGEGGGGVTTSGRKSGLSEVEASGYPIEAELGRAQSKKMQELYEKHMHKQSTHLEAKVLLGNNPYTSKTLIDMADRLLAPASGLQWDMTVINCKHAIRSDSGTHESDARVRASSVGADADSLSGGRGGGVGEMGGDEEEAIEQPARTVASRRSSWLTAMGVKGGGKKKEEADRETGANQKISEHTLIGIELQDFGDDSGSEEESEVEGNRGYRRSLGRRQLSDVFL